MDTFGDRSCCFTDVQPFVTRLVELGDGPALDAWLEGRSIEATQRLEAGSENAVKTPLTIRLTNLTQLRYACKRAIGNCDDAAFVEIAVQTHLLTVARSLPSEAQAREVRCDDELLLLATAALRKIPEDTPLSKFASLFEAVLISEYGGTVAPHSYSLKIDRIDLFRALGAGTPAVELFNSFGVRYIQLDSMSYLITPLMMELGLFAEVSLPPLSIIAFTYSGDTSSSKGRWLPRWRST